MEDDKLLTLRMTREVFEQLREIFTANPHLAVPGDVRRFIDLQLDEIGDSGTLILSASVFTE